MPVIYASLASGLTGATRRGSRSGFDAVHSKGLVRFLEEHGKMANGLADGDHTYSGGF